jgi:hypothetical protein
MVSLFGGAAALAVAGFISAQTPGAASSPVVSWDKPINPGSWRLPAPKGVVRWLIVRKVPSEGDAAFHVEVVQRKASDPPWKFEWLARHLAITESALRQSVQGPVRMAEPYPETYESAYKSWSSSAVAGNAAVCRTSVMECVQSQKP